MVEDLRAQIQAEKAEREQISAINREIESFRREHGLRFNRDTVQSLGEMLDGGYDVESAYNELAGQDFEATFDQALERLERKQGRSILQSEVDALWKHATDQDDPEDLPADKLLNMDNPRDRAQLIDERLSPTPDPEPVAPLADDATDAEREAYTAARMNGAEIEDPEDTTF